MSIRQWRRHIEQLGNTSWNMSKMEKKEQIMEMKSSKILLQNWQRNLEKDFHIAISNKSKSFISPIQKRIHCLRNAKTSVDSIICIVLSLFLYLMQNIFDSIKQINEYGQKYRQARQLAKMLTYSDFGNCENVIKKHKWHVHHHNKSLVTISTTSPRW